MKILVLGGASYDDIIHIDGFFEKKSETVYAKKAYSTAGSTGIAQAIALDKLGFDVSFQAIIGNDFYGEEIAHKLKKSGVNFYPLYVDKTERHTNIFNSNGEKISIFTHMPEDFDFDLVYKYEKLIKDTDVVVLNVQNYCRYFIPLLKRYKKKVFCDIHDFDGTDPSYQDFIRYSDNIFMNSDRISNYESFMKQMIETGKKSVVVTHAFDGASAADHIETVSIPANKVEVVDAFGAGDNFFAGYLYGMLNEYSLKDSLYMGRIVAESCIFSKEIVFKGLNKEYLLEKYKKLKKLVEKIYDLD